MFPINNTKFLCPPNPITGSMWKTFMDLQEDLKGNKPVKIFTYDSELRRLKVSEISKLTEHIEYPTSLSDKHTNCMYKYGDLELSGTSKIPLIVFDEPLRPNKINLRELYTEVNIKHNISNTKKFYSGINGKDYLVPNILEPYFLQNTFLSEDYINAEDLLISFTPTDQIFSDFDYFKLFLYSLGQFNLIEKLTGIKYVIYLDKIRQFTDNNESLIKYIINQVKYLNNSPDSNKNNKKRLLESIENYELTEDQSKLYFTLVYDGNMDYVNDIIDIKKLNYDSKSLYTYAHFFIKNLRSIYMSLVGEYKFYTKSIVDIEFIQALSIISGLVPLNTLKTYYTGNDIDCDYHNYYYIDLTYDKSNGSYDDKTETFLPLEVFKRPPFDYVNKRDIETPVKTGHILTWDQRNSFIVSQKHIPGDGSYRTTGAYLIG